MQIKLTLWLDEQVIARIKNDTLKDKISLSKFTENIFFQILGNSQDQSQNLTPIVNNTKGY